MSSLPTSRIRDQLIGGLIGSVVGDALGVPVEFTSRAQRDADPVIGMRGFGTWNQPVGTWSDDSSLTLTTADVLCDHGWDLDKMLDGFVAWLDEAEWTAHGKVFDVGNATRNALMLYRINHDRTSCGQRTELDNGNGSLMRVLPISCWLFGRDPAEQIHLSGEVSALTHAHIRSRLCCAWHTLWCDALLSGHDASSAARTAADRLRRHVPFPERPHLQRLLDGTAATLSRENVISGGYVVSAMETSLWCVSQHNRFADAILAAVNLGGDTDTIAAITGGMAGLTHGMAGIPVEWIDALARRGDILALANRFADACLDSWSPGGSP